MWYEHHVISGNYRLGEFQGAVLNAQLDRLEAQTKTRDRNGQYLAARLAKLPGLHPQKAPGDLHPAQLPPLHAAHRRRRQFGAPRAAVIEALQAEGIPCSPGYGFSLHQQPMFRNKAFGPYLPAAAAKLDYSKVQLPEQRPDLPRAGRLARASLFLGTARDMDDIARRLREDLRPPRAR